MKISRWVDHAPGTIETEDRVGALLRQVPRPLPLSPERLALVARRLIARPPRSSLWRLRWAMAVALVLAGSAGGAFATWGIMRWADRPTATPAAPVGPHRPARPRRMAARPVPPSPEAPLPVAQVKSLELPALTPLLAGRIASRPRAAPGSAASTAPSPLAAEAGALSAALAHLRTAHDPVAALATLDGYEARFPRGTLRQEAAAARVDALLMLGRRGDAAGLLRSLRLEDLGRAQELRLLRAELTAPSDCRGAIADFDALLARPGPSLWHERALYGRAACRRLLGDEPGAQGDLREYMRRFPRGRFAADVQPAL